MGNINFGKLIPGTISIPSSLEEFKRASQVRWTGSAWRYKGKVTATHGPAKGTWNSEESYGVQRQDNMYDKSQDKGLLISGSSGSDHESNYELYGDGRWMPASVWNGLGFESRHVQKGGNGKHNIYIKRYGAVFTHRTQNNNYRIYGWNTGNSNRPSGTDYRFDQIASSTSDTSEIRGWGPDYLFQGIVIQFANNSGNSTTQSEITIYNLKIGHKYSTIGGEYRYLPLGTRKWDERDKHPTDSQRFCHFSDPFTT